MENENGQVNEQSDQNNQVINDQNNQVNEQNDQSPPPKGATAFYKEQVQKMQEQLRLKEKEIQDRENRLKMIEEKQLIEKQDWQQLAEKYKNDYEQTSSQLMQIKNDFVTDKKLDAIKREALKNGILPDALNDIDTLDYSDVEIETTSTGRINVLGVQDFIEKLKTQKYYWFTETRPPNVNTGQVSESKPKEYTASDLLKLQKTNLKEYNRIMNERYKKRTSNTIF